MDFLLECVGFPPDSDLEDLARRARLEGEPVAWRGPRGEHYRLSLGGGLDVRFDREEGADFWSLHPYYRPPQRLRLAVDSMRSIPDSPYDALVTGWANPPPPDPEQPSGAQPPCPSEFEDAFALSVVLTDRRRLPRSLPRGHVLAVSVAGFALDVGHVGPMADRAAEAGLPSSARALPSGGWIAPLGGIEEPGGCVELCLPLSRLVRMTNPVTGKAVTRIEAGTPSKPLPLFVSPWQLATDELPAPRPGWCVEGTFLLTGRIEGGLESTSERLGSAFG